MHLRYDLSAPRARISIGVKELDAEDVTSLTPLVPDLMFEGIVKEYQLAFVLEAPSPGPSF